MQDKQSRESDLIFRIGISTQSYHHDRNCHQNGLFKVKKRIIFRAIPSQNLLCGKKLLSD